MVIDDVCTTAGKNITHQSTRVPRTTDLWWKVFCVLRNVFIIIPLYLKLSSLISINYCSLHPFAYKTSSYRLLYCRRNKTKRTFLYTSTTDRPLILLFVPLWCRRPESCPLRDRPWMEEEPVTPPSTRSSSPWRTRSAGWPERFKSSRSDILKPYTSK